MAEYLFEEFIRIPVEVEYASEFRYRDPILYPDDVVIAISQSGETADTIAAINIAKEKGAFVYGICNVVGSTISRITDTGCYTHAGPEIGVASTKAFTTQITVIALIGLYLGKAKGTLSRSAYQAYVTELENIPQKVERILTSQAFIETVAQSFEAAQNCIYLGRGYNFPVALEGALKLKEISYIHAEGYPAAEMKHGPIALIDKEMPVVVIATKKGHYEKVVSNIQEIKSREGRIIAIVSEGDTQVKELADYCLEIPESSEAFAPLLTTIPLQLLSIILPFNAAVTSINQETWRSLSLWSSYDRGYFLTPNHYLNVVVEITSPKLWVIPLSQSQKDKYEFIKEKREQGYYYKEISDMLNESDFTPQRTDKFTPQQVWGLESKMKKREKRLKKITLPSCKCWFGGEG